MPAGSLIGALFFIMVFFAAITSSISLMETIVSIISDKLGMKRLPACLIVFGVSLALGSFSALGSSVWSDFTIGGKQILDLFDFLSNSILMPIVAIITCVFIGYFLKPKTLIEELSIGGEFKAKRLFTVMIRYVAPVFILAILVTAILEVTEVIKI